MMTNRQTLPKIQPYWQRSRRELFHCQDGAAMPGIANSLSSSSLCFLSTSPGCSEVWWSLLLNSPQKPTQRKNTIFVSLPSLNTIILLINLFTTAGEEPCQDDLETQWRMERVASTRVWPSDKGEVRDHPPQGGSTSDPLITLFHSLHLHALLFCWGLMDISAKHGSDTATLKTVKLFNSWGILGGSSTIYQAIKLAREAHVYLALPLWRWETRGRTCGQRAEMSGMQCSVSDVKQMEFRYVLLEGSPREMKVRWTR